jgi:hypothetical protein
LEQIGHPFFFAWWIAKHRADWPPPELNIDLLILALYMLQSQLELGPYWWSYGGLKWGEGSGVPRVPRPCTLA